MHYIMHIRDGQCMSEHHLKLTGLLCFQGGLAQAMMNFEHVQSLVSVSCECHARIILASVLSDARVSIYLTMLAQD